MWPHKMVNMCGEKVKRCCARTLAHLRVCDAGECTQRLTGTSHCHRHAYCVTAPSAAAAAYLAVVCSSAASSPRVAEQSLSVCKSHIAPSHAVYMSLHLYVLIMTEAKTTESRTTASTCGSLVVDESLIPRSIPHNPLCLTIYCMRASQ